jgi:hypothetical protein
MVAILKIGMVIWGATPKVEISRPLTTAGGA